MRMPQAITIPRRMSAWYGRVTALDLQDAGFQGYGGRLPKVRLTGEDGDSVDVNMARRGIYEVLVKADGAERHLREALTGLSTSRGWQSLDVLQYVSYWNCILGHTLWTGGQQVAEVSGAAGPSKPPAKVVPRPEGEQMSEAERRRRYMTTTDEKLWTSYELDPDTASRKVGDHWYKMKLPWQINEGEKLDDVHPHRLVMTVEQEEALLARGRKRCPDEVFIPAVRQHQRRKGAYATPEMRIKLGLPSDMMGVR